MEQAHLERSIEVCQNMRMMYTLSLLTMLLVSSACSRSREDIAIDEVEAYLKTFVWEPKEIDEKKTHEVARRQAILLFGKSRVDAMKYQFLPVYGKRNEKVMTVAFYDPKTFPNGCLGVLHHSKDCIEITVRLSNLEILECTQAGLPVEMNDKNLDIEQGGPAKAGQ